jgi:hypothetical protein
VALRLAVWPPLFVASRRKRRPLSACVVAAVVWLVPLAPAMSAQVSPPSLESCHCSAGAGAPSTVAEKVAVAGSVTLWSAGCCVKRGAGAIWASNTKALKPPMRCCSSVSLAREGLW